MEEIKSPSLDEIKERIHQLENINLNSVDIDEIKSLLKLLFTGYTLSTPYIEPDQALYRGIIYKERPKHISFLSRRSAFLTESMMNPSILFQM